MSTVDWQQLLKVNTQRLGVAKVNRLTMAGDAARAAVTYRCFYERAVAGTTIPWWVVAALDYREESFDHSDYLGNGQPLSRKTTEVPRGRGPFDSWAAGAADAMKAVRLSVVGFPLVHWSDWSLAGAATASELWNGPGYAERGRPSPYVWAGTTVYSGGLYTEDGHYDASKIDPRVGCVAVWFAMQARGVDLGLPAASSLQTGTAGTAAPASPRPPRPAGAAGHSAALLGGAGAAILAAAHYVQTNGDHAMFDILCVVGVLALCYLGYWLYRKVKPEVAAVESAISKPVAKPAAGSTGPTGATGT